MEYGFPLSEGKGLVNKRPFGEAGPPGGGLGGICSRRGCAPHCRRRKVRSAPFPPAAKTAPAPLLLLSPPRGARRGPRIETSKRKCAAPGGKEKMFRRVGLRRRRPPAAGGGRLAVPCGNQGRKRAALGETSSPGNSGIPAAPLFAAAGRLLMRVSTWANATTPTPARAARSEAERAERGANQMRPCTPTTSVPSATGRQYRLRRRPKRARRQGQIGACTDPSTPVARRATAPERAKRFSLWTVHGPFLFWHDKREMGGASPLNKPPCGSRSPPGRRSAAPPTQQRGHLPSHPNDRISPAADSRPISQKRKNHAPCRTSSNNWHLN